MHKVGDILMTNKSYTLGFIRRITEHRQGYKGYLVEWLDDDKSLDPEEYVYDEGLIDQFKQNLWEYQTGWRSGKSKSNHLS